MARQATARDTAQSKGNNPLLRGALLERLAQHRRGGHLRRYDAADDPMLSVCFAAAAYGLQNAMRTSHSGASVRTAHVTGTLTDIGYALNRLLHRHQLHCRPHGHDLPPKGLPEIADERLGACGDQRLCPEDVVARPDVSLLLGLHCRRIPSEPCACLCVVVAGVVDDVPRPHLHVVPGAVEGAAQEYGAKPLAQRVDEINETLVQGAELRPRRPAHQEPGPL